MTTASDITRELDEIRRVLQEQEFSEDELRRLREELRRIEERLVRRAPKKTRSILELEGLGKDIWLAVDVDEYLRQERESWR